MTYIPGTRTISIAWSSLTYKPDNSLNQRRVVKLEIRKQTTYVINISSRKTDSAENRKYCKHIIRVWREQYVGPNVQEKQQRDVGETHYK